MAFGAFIWWTTDAGEDKTLYFDVCTAEGQELTSTVTEYPVEEGVNVADHVQKDLDKVTLEVFVSQEPIYDINSRGGKVSKIPINVTNYKAPLAPTPGAVFNAVGGAIKDAIGSLLGNKSEIAAQVLQFNDSFDAVADTLVILEDIKNSVQLVNVALPSKLYENMCLTHIGVKGDAGTGTGRAFDLDFTELRKVKVRIVNAPIPTEIRATVKKPKGAQSGKPIAKGPAKSVALAGAQELLPHLPDSVQNFFKNFGK